MKTTGSYFEYEQARNADLLRAYREQIERAKFIYLPEILQKTVDTPSRRFWVSEERAAAVVLRIMKGDDLKGMRPMKREMFLEIYRRVSVRTKDNPGITLCEAVADVVCEEAPRFYLTPGSAKVILLKIRKKWYEKRKRRLRFCCM